MLFGPRIDRKVKQFVILDMILSLYAEPIGFVEKIAVNC